MKRILHIVSSWGNGGVERYISSYIDEMNEYIFDILTIRNSEKESIFSKSIIEKGGKIFNLPQMNGNIFKRTNGRINALRIFLELNKYDVVHINAGTADAFILAKIIKKEYSEIKVVMHCHGNDVEAPNKILKKLFHETCKKIYGDYVDYCIGVSEITLSWMFKDKVLKNVPHCIFNCGIDIDKFEFNEQSRSNIRKKLNMENIFVIGTIGRFTEQKNPFYTIKIIKEISKIDNNFKFLWVGDGKLIEEIKYNAKKMGIYNKIIFYGLSKNAEELLSAMDLFILPSYFEGNPIVGIEAQANGLHCIFSDTITKEVKITERVDFMSIDKKEKEWAKRIVFYKNISVRKNNNIKKEIREHGCDMKENAQKLMNIYKLLVEGE